MDFGTIRTGMSDAAGWQALPTQKKDCGCGGGKKESGGEFERNIIVNVNNNSPINANTTTTTETNTNTGAGSGGQIPVYFDETKEPFQLSWDYGAKI